MMRRGRGAEPRSGTRRRASPRTKSEVMRTPATSAPSASTLARASARRGARASVFARRGARAPVLARRGRGTSGAVRPRVVHLPSRPCRSRLSVGAAALPDSSVLALLATCAAGAKLAEERTSLGASVSAPLLAMGAAMFLATVGILPPTSPAYDAVWSTIMPLAVVLSLLGADLTRAGARRAGVVLVAFAVGAVGSVLGAFVAHILVGHLLGPHAWKIAACLCASYVGGSLNYAATAQALGLSATPIGQAALAAGMAADNLAMAAFLAALTAYPADPPPREDRWDDASTRHQDTNNPDTRHDPDPDPKTSISRSASANVAAAAPTPTSLAVAFAAALLVLEIGRLSSLVVGVPGGSLGVASLIAPALAGAVAKRAERDAASYFLTGRGFFSAAPFAGATAVGGALMLTFFAALGAVADPRVAIVSGGATFAFIAVQLATHVAFTLVVGVGVLRVPMWAVLVGSNACVGGPATAAAMAAARGWGAAVQPAVVAGTLGYVVGTPLGCAAGTALRGISGGGF